MKKHINNRIEVLDGFRFIAVLSVILFHYYHRWESIYPPELQENLAPFDYFSHGYFGVQLFFVISGFVIAFTLTSTTNFFDFWKKRMIRLLPAMLICSLITFGVCVIFDTGNLFPNSHKIENVIYSITFISPVLLEKILSFLRVHPNYTSGSYWSLWPEIQFYFFSSLFYFMAPKKFFTSFAVFALLLYLINWIISHCEGTIAEDFVKACHLKSTADIFNISQTILWFLTGALFYQIYSGKGTTLSYIVLAFAALFLILDGNSWKAQTCTFLILLTFFIFIFSPYALKFLELNLFTTVGAASYSLYLIHEMVGVLFISKYALVFGKLAFIFPLIVLSVAITFAVVFYKYVEKPLSRKLKEKFLANQL